MGKYMLTLHLKFVNKEIQKDYMQKHVVVNYKILLEFQILMKNLIVLKLLLIHLKLLLNKLLMKLFYTLNKKVIFLDIYKQKKKKKKRKLQNITQSSFCNEFSNILICF